jgi:hypothetical protein
MKRIIALILLLASPALAQSHLQTRFLTVGPTVTAGAYASGQDVGGKQTLTALTCPQTFTGILVSAQLIDQAKNGTAYDLVFFSGNPTGTTFTDNATLDIADADMSKISAIVNLATTDAFGFNDNGTSYKGNLSIPLSSTAGVMYMAIVARGAPTYAATTDVTVKLSFLCD